MNEQSVDSMSINYDADNTPINWETWKIGLTKPEGAYVPHDVPFAAGYYKAVLHRLNDPQQQREFTQLTFGDRGVALWDEFSSINEEQRTEARVHTTGARGFEAYLHQLSFDGTQDTKEVHQKLVAESQKDDPSVIQWMRGQGVNVAALLPPENRSEQEVAKKCRQILTT